jgi:hypothetical protein
VPKIWRDNVSKTLSDLPGGFLAAQHCAVQADFNLPPDPGDSIFGALKRIGGDSNQSRGSKSTVIEHLETSTVN